MTNDLNKRIVLAGFLIVAGIAFLIRNLNLVPGIPDYIFSWPMLMILLGSFILVTKGKVILPVFLIGFGLYFLLPDIAGIDIHNLHIFWPLFFIVAGIIMALRIRTFDYEHRDKPEKIEADINQINLDSIGGLSRKIIMSQQFKGGKVNNIFGGSELNLLNAKLAPGRNYLELNTIFGGCTLIIPPDWNVNVDMVSVFGGFSDKRQIAEVTIGDSSLVIRGACIFGGGEISSRKK